MRALTIPRFGAADVLKLAELEPPEPGPGEVAIDVAFAGANHAEIHFRQGAVDVPLPYVPGIEVSGHVRAVGDGVDGLRVGQPVAALTIVDGGGYAEAAVTDAPVDQRADDTRCVRPGMRVPVRIGAYTTKPRQGGASRSG